MTVEPLEWICSTCGYGAVLPHEPPQCPICRGTDWQPRPRGGRRSDSDLARELT